MAKKNQFIKKLDLSQDTKDIPVFKTDRELIEYLFITEVIKEKWPLKKKITDKTLLTDFIPKEHTHPEFIDGFLQMYQDMALIKFGQSIVKIKNKPVKEIIDYIAKRRAWGRS